MRAHFNIASTVSEHCSESGPLRIPRGPRASLAASTDSKMAAWITLLNVVTGISEVFLKLSPTPDIYNVHRSKSSGEVAELPIVTMTMSCHLWYVARSLSSAAAVALKN
jgi:hypothetical protein